MLYKEVGRFAGMIIGLAFFTVGFFNLIPEISNMASFGIATAGVAIQIASQLLFREKHIV